MADDALTDFERTTFTHDGTTRDVFRLGAGPAVIVIAEMPGITPKVAQFARRVAGIGCEDDANPVSKMPAHSVVTEHLVDEPGQPTRQALDEVLDLFRSRRLT